MNAATAQNVYDPKAGSSSIDRERMERWERLETTLRAMRGRWKRALLCGLVGMVIGGALGWILPTPHYTSTGIIRINAELPKVLFEEEEKKITDRFEEYVKSKIALLQSTDTIQKAMENEKWQATGEGSGIGTRLRFSRSLKIVNERNNENLTVTFRDPSPEHAQAALSALFDAFMVESKKQEASSEFRRLEKLQEEKADLEKQLNTLRHEILDATDQLGADSVTQLYSIKLRRMERLEQELDFVLSSITALRQQETTEASNPTVALTRLASYDIQLRNFLQQRFMIEQEITRMLTHYGEEHRLVREQRNMLAAVNDNINFHLQQLQMSVGAMQRQDEIARLKSQEKGIRAILEGVRKEAEELGRRGVEVNQLLTREKEMDQKLVDIRNRMYALDVESTFRDRLSVFSYPDKPNEPSTDNRKLGLFALGFFGFVVGFGIVAFVGFMDPTIKSFDDARATIDDTAVLGLLPVLPTELENEEDYAAAAHCVHNIRTMVQIAIGRTDERAVFSITSSGPQSGKTSLSHALGLSFAGTGSRTLLIDADLVAGGLSRRVAAITPTRRENALVRAGLIEAWQLEKGRTTAELARRDLVDVLAEAGYLAGHEVDRARTLLREAERGLLDVVTGRPLDECAVETEVPNLFILAVGNADEHDVSRLSLKSVRRVLEQAREQFDAVIVDTGPTPASLEASMFGAEVDGVVMVVARGEERLHAEQAVEHLRQVGARVLGMVFNRADEDDMIASGAASMSRRSLRPEPRTHGMDDLDVSANPSRDPFGRSIANTSEPDIDLASGRPDDDDDDDKPRAS